MIEVTEEWFARAKLLIDAQDRGLLPQVEDFECCPFCGADAACFVIHPADELFKARTGCSVCDRWFGPVVFK